MDRPLFAVFTINGIKIALFAFKVDAEAFIKGKEQNTYLEEPRF